MRRTSATTKLVVCSYCILQYVVRVLSYPEQVTAVEALGVMGRSVAFQRTRVERLRSEFLMVPVGFLSETNTVVMLSGLRWLHTMLLPVSYGPIHTPLVLMMEAS